MARKSAAPKELRAAHVTTPRDRIWVEIRKQRRFSYASINKKTRVADDTIRAYTKALIAGDFVKEVVPERRVRRAAREFDTIAGEFELVNDVGVHAPRLQDDGTEGAQGVAQLNMWRAMKILGEFDWRDLVSTATTDDVPISQTVAKQYIGHLHAAGYLDEVQPGRGGLISARPPRYRLPADKNTGPRAPTVQRVKQIFDPNQGKVVWTENAAEVFDAAH